MDVNMVRNLIVTYNITLAPVHLIFDFFKGKNCTGFITLHKDNLWKRERKTGRERERDLLCSLKQTSLSRVA